MRARAPVGLVLPAALTGFVRCGAQQPALQAGRADGCEVTVPAEVKVGEEIEIRVKVTGPEAKVFLSCDLQDQNHGMVSWGAPPRVTCHRVSGHATARGPSVCRRVFRPR